MIRSVLVVLLSFTFLPMATASLARRKPREIKRNIPDKLLESFRPAPASNEFRLTAKTEVLLDGRPCRYEDVPDGATIILLETATNWSKEIVKIHFQSGGRRPPSRSAPAATGQSRTPKGMVP
jgi:hypothetical protein